MLCRIALTGYLLGYLNLANHHSLGGGGRLMRPITSGGGVKRLQPLADPAVGFGGGQLGEVTQARVPQN